jgi:hypothetical protein
MLTLDRLEYIKKWQFNELNNKEYHTIGFVKSDII